VARLPRRRGALGGDPPRGGHVLVVVRLDRVRLLVLRYFNQTKLSKNTDYYLDGTSGCQMFSSPASSLTYQRRPHNTLSNRQIIEPDQKNSRH
jgi:hypothetical protein